MGKEDRSRNFIRKFGKVILIAVICLIVGGAVFLYFKIKTEAHDALREAKNVRMALVSADIEMYGIGKTVFDPFESDGLMEGAKAKAEKIYMPDGVYKVTSYDYDDHEITGMTYRNGHYVVTYMKKGDNTTWDVNYQLNVYHSDESDVIVD